MRGGSCFVVLATLVAFAACVTSCAGRAEEPSGSGGAFASGGAGAGGTGASAGKGCAEARCCDLHTGEITPALCDAAGEPSCSKSDGYLSPGQVCAVNCLLGQAEQELNGKACAPGALPCAFGTEPTDSCVCDCDPDSSIWVCTCTV